MGILSFAVKYINAAFLQDKVFHYVQPMAVGFIIYAAIRAMRISIKSNITIGIMVIAAVVTILIRSPWVFPLVIIIGGLITNFTNKEFPPQDTKLYDN